MMLVRIILLLILVGTQLSLGADSSTWMDASFRVSKLNFIWSKAIHHLSDKAKIKRLKVSDYKMLKPDYKMLKSETSWSAESTLKFFIRHFRNLSSFPFFIFRMSWINLILFIYLRK